MSTIESNASEKGMRSGQRSPSPTRSPPIGSPDRSPSPDVDDEEGVTAQVEHPYPHRVAQPREMNDKLVRSDAFNKKYRFTHPAVYDVKHVI